MAVYTSVPILDELVQSVEDSPTYEAVNAMACGILSYYFAPVNGYVVALERGRNDHSADMAIYRIRRRFPGDQSTLDHTFVGVKGPMAPTEQSLDLLEGALERSTARSRECWAVIIHGSHFEFYKHHILQPVNNRLAPWGPPDQDKERNSFHVRDDSVIIDWMLRHMVQFNIPPSRWRRYSSPETP